MLIPLEQKICDEIVKSKKEMISLLKELISIPSNNPPGENYNACVEIIYKYLKNIGASVEIIQAPHERLSKNYTAGENLNKPNIFAEIKGYMDGPHIHFNGHYDVVPATGNWASNPYKPCIKDSKLFGRGAADMKGGIAAMLIAAKVIVSQNIPFRGIISFSFVQDEENDGETGSKYLINKKDLKADYCIVGEPSGADSFYLGHYGSLWLEVNTYGKAAHGSAPDEGINAFEKMVDFVNEIRAGSEFCLQYEKKPINEKKNINHKGATTLGGEVSTGAGINIVPDMCRMTIDRRLAPGEDTDMVLKNFSIIMETLSRKDPYFKGKLKVLSGFNACTVAEDSHFAQVVIGAIKSVAGYQPEISIMKASCDMRYFHWKGIPTLIYGPGKISQAHQTDEYIDLESLLMAAKVYTLIILRLLQVSDREK